jgi:hypothetical protein
VATPSSFFPIHSLFHSKKVGRPWTPLKNCSTKGKDFELNSFCGEHVEGKKMLFQPFKSSFNGWLVSKLEFYILSLPWYLSFVWSKLELSFEAISID